MNSFFSTPALRRIMSPTAEQTAVRIEAGDVWSPHLRGNHPSASQAGYLKLPTKNTSNNMYCSGSKSFSTLNITPVNLFYAFEALM